MILLISIIWMVIMFLASRSKNQFLIFFVVCQFVFIGMGLLVFQYVGKEYIQTTFSGFNFATINDDDFIKASFILLSGVFTATVTTLLLEKNLGFIKISSAGTNGSSVNKNIFLFLSFVCIAFSIPYITSNLASLIKIFTSSSTEDIATFTDMRREANSSYLTVLIIYNILPSLAIMSIPYYLARKNKLNLKIFTNS